MRPSDEHQHRSKRPNLFSSSRGKAGADDNILARLERMPADAAVAPGTRARTVMFGGAALVIAGLVGTLTMLTRDNVSAPRPMQVSVPPLASATSAPPAPTALDDVRATILDEAPADAPIAAVPASVPVVHPEPDLPISVPATRPQSTATIQTTRPAAPAAAAPARPQVAAAKSADKPAARPQRQSAPAADDPDVAILTAILSQAPRHSDRNAEPECGGPRGKPCSSQY